MRTQGGMLLQRRGPIPLQIGSALRIRNELAKLGIEIATSTVAKYMGKQRKPPSPSWRAFLGIMETWRLNRTVER